MPGSLHTVIYTSGSTGMAKGVMVGDRCWNDEMINYPSEIALSTLSYMPLSHITDRHHAYVTLFNGGRIGMISSAV